MALSTTSSRVDYTGNGAVNTYSFSFPIVAASDLVLQVADTSTPPNVSSLTFGTDYSVNGVGASAGGSIALTNSGQAWLSSGNLKSGYILTIRRVRPLTQTTDIRNQGVYYPEIIETEFDNLTMLTQQLQELISRCVSFPVLIQSSQFNPILPDGPLTPGSALVINPSGDAFQWQPPVGGSGIYGTPAQETPSGTVNGTNVTFTLTNTPISNASVSFYVDGLIQVQGVEYTISGDTITATAAPSTGQQVYAVYQH